MCHRAGKQICSRSLIALNVLQPTERLTGFAMRLINNNDPVDHFSPHQHVESIQLMRSECH